MIYGDPSYTGSVSWLTVGAAQIPFWRYNLAMALAFPGIILYGVALFSVQQFIVKEREKKIYHYLNAFGLTPWIALHLFYVMLLVLFAWLNGNGFAGEAIRICEGLFSYLSWLIPVCEVMMLPVFIYWFYLQATGRTVFPRRYAFTNVLIIFAVLKGLTVLMPVSAFRLGFTNGLMSESMVIWFAFMVPYAGNERHIRVGEEQQS